MELWILLKSRHTPGISIAASNEMKLYDRKKFVENGEEHQRAGARLAFSCATF